MKAIITVEMDNAAFGESHMERMEELRRILEDLPARISLARNFANDGNAEGLSLNVRDINGNKVGTFQVIEEPHERTTRTGCQENVCWCHVDSHPPGFMCSSCGCVIV